MYYIHTHTHTQMQASYMCIKLPHGNIFSSNIPNITYIYIYVFWNIVNDDDVKGKRSLDPCQFEQFPAQLKLKTTRKLSKEFWQIYLKYILNQFQEEKKRKSSKRVYSYCTMYSHNIFTDVCITVSVGCSVTVVIVCQFC